MEQRIGEGKSAFVVNDRRGEKKAPREEEAVVTVDRAAVEATKDKSKWKDVSYLIVQAQMQAGQVLNILRACGERSDGRPFMADWILPPFWTEKTDIVQVATKNAKGRLDTFLNCHCIEGQKCSDHRESIEMWGKLDTERITRLMSQPMPSSLELIIRAEQSAQAQKLHRPRG